MRLLATLAWGILFFLVFTPCAWVFRRLRPDPLRLRADPQAQSFWRPRKSGHFRPMTSRF